jgi:hypothetical protein
LAWRRRNKAETLLRSLGAIDLPDLRGYIVYVLWNSADTVIYVGQSASLVTRLERHLAKHGDKIARISVIRCESRRRMDLTEAWLIDRLQPGLNISGTWQGADIITDFTPETAPAPAEALPGPEEMPAAELAVELAGELEAAEDPAPVVRLAVSPEYADQKIREWIAAQDGAFSARTMVPLADDLVRSRAWLYRKLADLGEEGVIVPAGVNGLTTAALWRRAG